MIATQPVRSRFGFPGAGRLVVGLGLAGLAAAAPAQNNRGSTPKSKTTPARSNSSRVEAGTVTYHGWKGALRLSNGVVDLVYVPQVGRVMRYGPIGGTNLLWEKAELHGQRADPATAGKEWTNFGGDKLWPAPQARWNWPPDPALDGAAASARISPARTLKVIGQTSAQLGLRFEREIRLEPAGTGVVFHNTLVNVGKKPVEWSVWEVVQIDDPEEASFTEFRTGRFPGAFYPFPGSPPLPGMVRVEASRVVFRRHVVTPGKIGGDAPDGRVQGVVKGLRFEISAPVEANGEYPDDGCAEEIWSNPDPDRYMELELLSPLRKIPAGGSTSFVTRWRLVE